MHLPLEEADQGWGSLHWKATTSMAVIVQVPINIPRNTPSWRVALRGERLYTWKHIELFARPKVTT